MNEEIYKVKPSIFQKFIALTNQKEILVSKICDNIQKVYKKDELSILDIGCGDGKVLIPVIENLKDKYNLDITAIDSSSKLLESFKSNCKYNVNYILEDIQKIEEFSKADFILLSHVLAYVDNLEVFMPRILKALKDRGEILIVLGNELSDDFLIKEKLNNKKMNITTNAVRKILDNKKINYNIEVVESKIDVTGIENMNEDGKTIIEFFKHKVFEEIDDKEINILRNLILEKSIDNKITKRENYICIKL